MPARYIAFAFALLFFLQSASARKLSTRAEVDSIRKAAIMERRAEADSIRQHVVQRVFSPEHADSLLLQIEHLHSTLNNITNESKYGFKTLEIEKDLAQMQYYIQEISESLGRDSMVMNINNLQMYRGLLNNMAEKLNTWRTVLYQDNKGLSDMTAEMQAFVKDSFARKIAADTAFANLHLDEMLILKEKWHEAKAETKANLFRIGKLQTAVSNSYFDVTELQNKVGNQLAVMGAKAFGKEYNYIWNSQNPANIGEVVSLTMQSFKERISVLKYYLALNIATWLSIVLTGIIFFIWVFRNFRKIKLLPATEGSEDTAFKYIGALPVLSSFIFMLNIAPFYGFSQPVIYIEILHLLLLIPLTILFWRLWPRQLFFYWCILAGFSVLTFMMNAIITPGWPLRFFLLFLNLGAVIFGFRFLSCYKKTQPLGKVVKLVAILYIVLNALAVITNIVGRLTIAKILASAGVIGLTQIIGLFVLVPMLIEAFFLQMKSRRISKGMAQQFNYDDIQDGLYQLLSAAVIILWLVTFATNLEIYTSIIAFLDILLNTSRKIGSATYTIGNIFAFILILYIVNIVQKYIGYFFGETEEDFISDLDKRESRLVLFRLAIIMAGFFIAVVASGLPVDKVTVVLGALGVGIGLGLQNIVYNLISGVILIFEKPMQIGDYIEVADKKGRVQSIGIRASKLVTSDGSEVTVPNGDILSSHMVNWTKGNNNRRAQLTMKIEPATQLQTAKDTILEELKHNQQVIQQRPVEILLLNLSESEVEISINVWIKNLYKEEQFKSEMLSSIYSRLAEKGIKIV